MKPTNSPEAPDFEQQARRLLARYAESMPAETSVEARVRSQLAATQEPQHPVAPQRPVPRLPRWQGEWARGAISLALVITLIAGFMTVLRLHDGATSRPIQSGGPQDKCVTVLPNHTIKLCAAHHVTATISLGQAYADPTRTEVVAHVSLSNADLNLGGAGGLTKPESVFSGNVTLQDSQGHIYLQSDFTQGFNYGQEVLNSVYGPNTPTLGFFAFDPLPQDMLSAPQTLTLHISDIAIFYMVNDWQSSLLVNGSWTFTFQVTPQAGRSISFNVAPQTFSGVTVQPLRLDIGGKGNDFDYLGSGERLILRVSGLAPDTRRSTVANMSFKYFDKLGAGQAGGEADQLLFEGQRPAGVAGMHGEPSLTQDPVVGPSGTIDLEVIFLGLPQLTGTQTLALTQLATAKSGDTFSFANGNWEFALPLG